MSYYFSLFFTLLALGMPYTGLSQQKDDGTFDPQPELFLESLESLITRQSGDVTFFNNAIAASRAYFESAGENYLRAHFLMIQIDELLNKTLDKLANVADDSQESKLIRDAYQESLEELNTDMSEFRRVIMATENQFKTILDGLFNRYFNSPEREKDRYGQLITGLFNQMSALDDMDLFLAQGLANTFKDVASKYESNSLHGDFLKDGIFPFDYDKIILDQNQLEQFIQIDDETSLLMQGEESVQEGAQFQMIREKSEAAWRRFQDEKMNQKNPQGSLNGKRRTYRHPGLPNDSDDGFETDIKYFVKTLYTTCKTHCPSAETKGNITGRTFPKGTWVLTYDDGPKDSRSRAILDHLNDHGMKGTFFWLTKALKSTSGKNLGKEVLDEGHELANHSETHADLSKSSADLNREISKTQSFFAKEFGHTPKFFRLPYGAGAKNGSAARKKIAAEKMIHIFWNVDTLDWKDKVPSSIFQRAKKQMLIEGRGVVLFHDIHSQSVSASNMLVDWIASHSSFKVKPLSVVIDSLNQ